MTPEREAIARDGISLPPMHLIDDGAAVRARSPAKLNLLLAIHGRRPDGFHEIETLMVKVSVYDALRFSPRDDGRLVLRVRATSPDFAAIPTGPDNLVLRAAELLRSHAGIRNGADIELVKQIPAEAGLAGGSGNAAACKKRRPPAAKIAAWIATSAKPG